MNAFRPYKRRKLRLEDPVRVYRNLHRGKEHWYSIQQQGKVVAHTQEVLLFDCTMHLSAKGRARVIQSKRKNVHAYLRGWIDASGILDRWNTPMSVLRYDPYKDLGFIDNRYGCLVKSAQYVLLNQHGAFYYKF